MSAQLRLTDFTNFIFNNGIWLILGVVILIRPLGVIASSLGQILGSVSVAELDGAEGVVAGSMASFCLKLEPFETKQIFYRRSRSALLIHGSSFRAGAGKVANFLSVKSRDRVGWLIIGAHLLA